MSETMDVPLVKLDMMKTESFEDDHVDTSQYFSLVNVKEEKIQMDISFPTVKSESEEEAIWNDTVLKGEVKEEHQILQESETSSMQNVKKMETCKQILRSH
ncbi:uncharacterized protein [Periplaneta americana]|uniref:uncharacterized protein isoform X12 n=1 Tax=Periplaneta americana TaxID=6978 RepID=UPI0037E9763D